MNVDSNKVFEFKLFIFLKHLHFPVDIRIEYFVNLREINRQIKLTKRIVLQRKPIPNKQLVVIRIPIIDSQLLSRQNLSNRIYRQESLPSMHQKYGLQFAIWLERMFNVVTKWKNNPKLVCLLWIKTHQFIGVVEIIKFHRFEKTLVEIIIGCRYCQFVRVDNRL